VHESVAIRLSTHEPLFTVGRTRRLQQRQGQAVLRITEESFLGFVSRSFILKGATLKPSCWTASRTTCLRLYLRRRRSPGSSSSSLFFLSTFRDRSVSCRVPTLGSAVERLRSMSRNNKLIGVVLAQPVRVSKFVLCARRCLLSFLPSTMDAGYQWRNTSTEYRTIYNETGTVQSAFSFPCPSSISPADRSLLPQTSSPVLSTKNRRA
jgi:hypothetical protein